jgi:hypothetical protein
VEVFLQHNEPSPCPQAFGTLTTASYSSFYELTIFLAIMGFELRQVLYHLSHASSPLGYFRDKASFLSGANLYYDSTILNVPPQMV